MAAPPVTREQLDALNATDGVTAIPWPVLLQILQSPPFIPTPSFNNNLRDMGAVEGSRLVPGRFFRSAILDHDQETRAWLQAHVTRIFDLRRPQERVWAPDPPVPGVENVWRDAAGDQPLPQLDEFGVGDGSQCWGGQYMLVATTLTPIIREILQHVRDRPADAFLIHCTAGKDRTGVVAGMLQALAGSPADAVLFDYMLSRIGFEPIREQLLFTAMMDSGPAVMATPGFFNMNSIRPTYWTAFQALVDERFGGWDGYVTGELGFSAEDLETIKRHLRGE